MSQKKVVFYLDSGEIVSRRSGTVANVDIAIEASSLNHVDITRVDHDVTVEDYYVSDNEVLAKGERPSESYTFNYASGSWELDIELAKGYKWESIKDSRNAQEFGTFEWGGYTFQCDEVSQRRIQGSVQLSAIDDTLTLDWTLADNSVQTFTAADYIQIGQALAVHVSQCHERGRILRLEIEAATTLEELEAIVW